MTEAHSGGGLTSSVATSLAGSQKGISSVGEAGGVSSSVALTRTARLSPTSSTGRGAAEGAGININRQPRRQVRVVAVWCGSRPGWHGSARYRHPGR